MVDRIWLKYYPAGIPAEIDLDRYNSLGDLFDDIVDKFSDKKSPVIAVYQQGKLTP